MDLITSAKLISSTVKTNICRLKIGMEQTPVGISLYCPNFFISQGERLCIHTPGGDQLLGVYTHETYPRHGAFASEPLSDNKLILDYEAPHGPTILSVQISGVNYLYHSTLKTKEERNLGQEDTSDPARSEYYQLNIGYPEGDEWQE